jgi:transketolase
MNTPVVYSEDYDFEIGKAIILREGTDISIIATGTMVHSSLKAARFIEERGLSCKVIDMHTIKPLDQNMICMACETKLIVTVEEHSFIGGLGGAVAECLAQSDRHPPLLIIGISDEYKRPGDYFYLLEQYGLTPQKIAEKILNRFQELSLAASPDASTHRAALGLRDQVAPEST